MDINEASLIEREFTVRDLRLTKEVLETRRALTRWLALSLGIINPGESRRSAVAVFDALLYFQFIQMQEPSVIELSSYIGTNWGEINEKTLRYHLLKMKKTGLVENTKGHFYLKQFGLGDKTDIEDWTSGLFEEQYGDIRRKVAGALKEFRDKNNK